MFFVFGLDIFSCEVAALDLLNNISVSNPFLNLVMQLKCLSPVHSVSALIKFHTSILSLSTILGLYRDRHYRNAGWRRISDIMYDSTVTSD